MTDKNLKLKEVDINKLEESVNPFNKAQWYRLQRGKKDVESSGNRNLDYAFNMIQDYSRKLELDKDTVDTICNVYDCCVEKDILRGRSIEYLVSSTVYIGLRLDGIVRSSSEVCEVCKVGEKEMLRLTRVICKECGYRLPLLTPQDFVPRCVEALGVGKAVEDKTYSLLEECEVAGLCNGPSPTSMCAVCLYVACTVCDERRTQRDVADVCGVTDVTIRSRLRNIRKTLDWGV